MNKISVIFSWCALVFLSCLKADTDSNKMELEYKLLQALEAFSSENNITMSKTQTLLNDLIRNQELYPIKGGLGLIKGNVFVELSGEQNKLVLVDGDDWIGNSRNIAEAVLIAENRIVSNVALDQNADLILVQFTPEKVQICECKDGSGGYFSRLD